MTSFAIEPARPDDVEALPRIEREAASRLADCGLPAAVLEQVTPLAELAAAQRAGRLWVARGETGSTVGFALVTLVDGQPHLQEMDVVPSEGRRGIGRALVRAVQAWASASGYVSVTLTTFRDVPWNAPFYGRMGFVELSPHERSPALRAIVREEAARGLDPQRRVVMSWPA